MLVALWAEALPASWAAHASHGNRCRLARPAASKGAGRLWPAAEQRGAARSVREDTGCGAAFDAVKPVESGRTEKQRRRSAPSLWGVELAARVCARRTGGRSPREPSRQF